MTTWATAPWTPRDWQRDALPKVLGNIDRNPVVRAVMGAGKSVLLAEVCAEVPERIVVLTPTQALVTQLASTFRARGLDVGEYYADRKQTNKRITVCCNDSLPSLSKKVEPPHLFIVDEAHKSECDTVHDTLLGPRSIETGERDESAAWMPTYRAGCTATPFRANENERLSLFETLVYDYGPTEAMRDGVIVPPRQVHYHGEHQHDTNRACIEMIAGAVGDNLGPGLVDSRSIEDAHEFSDLLVEEAGLRCKPVHSRMHRSTVDKRIAMLERGELNCLVHVNMLSEGVDLPWLRWLCCRRPISSPVLFAQYVGRGMRSLDLEKFPQHAKYGPKKHVTVFDPHRLFETHGIDNYAAVLGVSDTADPLLPDIPLDFLVEQTRREGPGETMNGVPVRFITPTESYIVRLRLEWQCEGLISMRLPELRWRDEPMTTRQRNKVAQLAFASQAPEVPDEHRRWLRTAIRTAEHQALSRGVASDLISILDVLRAYTWPGTEVQAA